MVAAIATESIQCLLSVRFIGLFDYYLLLLPLFYVCFVCEDDSDRDRGYAVLELSNVTVSKWRLTFPVAASYYVVGGIFYRFRLSNHCESIAVIQQSVHCLYRRLMVLNGNWWLETIDECLLLSSIHQPFGRMSIGQLVTTLGLNRVEDLCLLTATAFMQMHIIQITISR